MAVVRRRFYAMASQGFQSFFTAKVNALKVNIRGSVEDYLSVPLQLVGAQNGAVIFHGGSPVLPISEDRDGVSLDDTIANLLLPVGHADENEDFVFGRDGLLEAADGARGAPLRFNTPEENCEFSLYADWETALIGSGTPLEQFTAALADQTRKPDALERVPPEPL